MSSFAGADRSAKVTHSELLFASFLIEHLPFLVVICQFCQLNAKMVQSGPSSQEVIVCMLSNVVKMLTISPIFELPNLPIFCFTGWQPCCLAKLQVGKWSDKQTNKQFIGLWQPLTKA